MSQPSTSEKFKTLDDIARGKSAVVTHVSGERSFRRRLMEMGLVPGTRVTTRNIAPLGDPIEIEVRGCRLSIRRFEATRVKVRADDEERVRLKVLA